MSRTPSVTGWRRFLPITVWLRSYRSGSLVFDLIAALTIWALVVPEAMAYASLAGMPPEYGLYAALVAPLAYAIFGTSRQLNVGPSSTVAVLSASLIAPLAAGGDAQLFVSLTAALALLTGLFFVLGGLLRLGFLADLMSRPVLEGFVVGLAMTIASGQLHKLFGVHSTGEYPDNFFGDLAAVFLNLDETVVITLAIGVASLVGLFALEKAVPRIPAALVVAGTAIVVVAAFGLEEQGVEVIGDIPAGLPSLGWPALGLDQWLSLVPGAMAIVIVGFAESIAAARAYARKYGYKVDADQEMVGMGVANAASGMVGSFVVDGSLSKTAAGDQAGQKTQLASVVLSAAVFVTILFLTGLFYSLPEATLGAIVIHAVWHLIDFEKVARYLRFRREDFYAGLAGLLGVLLLDILAGLAIAVAVSFALLLARVSRPQWNVLGRVRDEEADEIAFQSVDSHPDAETFPGLLIARFDGDLFFANANTFTDDVRTAVAAADPRPRVVLVDGESVNDIDATALDAIGELRGELEAQGIELWVARIKASVWETAERAEGFTIGRRFPSVRTAVAAFQALPAAEETVAEERRPQPDPGEE